MSCTSSVRASAALSVADAVAGTGEAIQHLLKITSVPAVVAWRQRSLELSPLDVATVPNDGSTVVMHMAISDSWVWLSKHRSPLQPADQTAEFAVHLSGARTCFDVALGAAVALAVARLMDSPITDAEGCFGGPREESAGDFLQRLRIDKEHLSYREAVREFARKNQLLPAWDDEELRDDLVEG